MATTVLVHDFLKLLHQEMSSEDELTLSHSKRRYTGELLSSVSRMVLRQSSTASFMEVTVRMKIRGTEPRPGFEAPNMEKIYSCQRKCEVDEGHVLTLRMMMKKKYMLAML